jgi:hypothetical protein
MALDITVKGDLAYLSCKYAVSVEVKYSGEKFTDIGKMVNIFKRESFGKWKCISSIWNSNYHTIDFHSRIPADFSGTWVLDLKRSSPVPDLISSQMVIIQKGNNINIERSYELQGKEPLKNQLNCTIGRENKSNSSSGSLVTTSSWSDDKQSFTIVEKLLSAGKEYKRTTGYSITSKGESLKITSFDQIPHGLFITNQKQIVLTYDKLQYTKDNKTQIR